MVKYKLFYHLLHRFFFLKRLSADFKNLFKINVSKAETMILIIKFMGLFPTE